MDNANELMIQAAATGVDGLVGFSARTSLSGNSWLNSQSKLEQLHELRTMALGNAKILYGSEKFKYYDVVVAHSEPDAMFAVVLVCSFNEATKILRKEIAPCPIAAARAIVHGLHVNSGLLLTKYDVGDQLFGQQGGTPREGDFGLYDWKSAVRDATQDQDDTSSLLRGGVPAAPMGPRADKYANKRPRWGIDRGTYKDRDSDSRESDGTLTYDG